MAQENEQQIKVRNVWASNLLSECNHIVDSVGSYSFASIKCKNFVHCSKYMCRDFERELPPEFVYDYLKLHIANTPLIQFGFTLFNSNQELPVIEGHPTIWVFNFNMSDSGYCPNILSKPYLEMLELRGVDLEVNRKDGVDPVIFKDILLRFLRSELKVVTWISFMGMYDFGYLIKILVAKSVFPETLSEFKGMTNFVFGEVYDVKIMTDILNINGSLDEIRETIGIGRVAGSEVGNAGFDSHLIMQVFMALEMKSEYWYGMEHIVGIFCGFSETILLDDE